MVTLRGTAGLFLVLGTAAIAACGSAPVLTQLVEARRLASELRVELAHAADAANRAVMADTDDAATVAAKEAQTSIQAMEQELQALRPLLTSLAYGEELQLLDRFQTAFDEYRKLDAEILSLAVENTNVKAQRLSFGPAREAADTFRRALDGAATHGTRERYQVEALTARANAAVLDILAAHAPHIAEPEDAAMTRMEEQMAASGAAARQALAQLTALLPPSASPQVKAATEALARFDGVTREIITLSRRNSDVRSLALSLGRNRTLTAACDEQLGALQQALAKHEFTATR